MASTLLIENGTILTLGEKPRLLVAHALFIENGTIARIAPKATLMVRVDKTIDARGMIVMPGLINAHTHFYSTFARGIPRVLSSNGFPEILKNLWWKLDQALTTEDCEVSALVSCVNAIKHGTTTLIDHHASPKAVRGSLVAIAKAVKAAGLRACLCYEVTDRNGAGIAKEGLAENAEFIRRCQNEADPQLKALFGLHASFTLTGDTLTAAVARGRELNTGFHIHAAEAEYDQQFTQQRHTERVVERLKKFGVLGPKTILAHCVHVSEQELAILAATKTMVVHNPQSNLNNAVGIADLVAMQRHGVVVGLGTDAMTVNMFEEVRTGLWSQHLRQRSPSAGFEAVTSALFRNNARIAKTIWEVPLGELAEGAPADIICIPYHPPTPLTAETMVGHLVFGISQERVDTTIVGGRVLMEHGRLQIDVDEERLGARARELAAGVWKRFSLLGSETPKPQPRK
jgi:putative selenium metabolism protein SsnA